MINSTHLVFDVTAWSLGLAVGLLQYRWHLSGNIKQISIKLDGYYFISLGAGAVVGAYFFGTLNLYLSGINGIGRSIAGAIAGAIVGVELYKSRRHISESTGWMFVLPMIISMGIGRIGCLFSGLDDFTHGIATGHAWGWDYGDGIKRHPVQLYEASILLFLFVLAATWLVLNRTLYLKYAFYAWIGSYGAERFAFEFFKPYGKVIGPLNIFHILCMLLIIYGLVMLRRTYDGRA